jgi:hypothetical protein
MSKKSAKSSKNMFGATKQLISWFIFIMALISVLVGGYKYSTWLIKGQVEKDLVNASQTVKNKVSEIIDTAMENK